MLLLCSPYKHHRFGFHWHSEPAHKPKYEQSMGHNGHQELMLCGCFCTLQCMFLLKAIFRMLIIKYILPNYLGKEYSFIHIEKTGYSILNSITYLAHLYSTKHYRLQSWNYSTQLILPRLTMFIMNIIHDSIYIGYRKQFIISVKHAPSLNALSPSLSH